MKRNLVPVIGLCLIITACAGAGYSGEDERRTTSSRHDWINPDGSGGILIEPAVQPLDLANSRHWVNPDGSGGTVSGTNVGRLDLLNSNQWVNPDGFHGTFKAPVAGDSPYTVVTTR